MPSRSLTTPSGRPASFGRRVRDRIDSTKIVSRLQAFVNEEEINGEKVEMTSNQLTAARILLDRTVPVLKAKEVDMGDDADIKTITNDRLFAAIEGECERK